MILTMIMMDIVMMTLVVMMEELCGYVCNEKETKRKIVMMVMWIVDVTVGLV